MSSVAKFVLLTLSLCLSAATLAFSGPAEACSPPLEGWRAGTLEISEPVPTNGVVAFEMSAWSQGPLSIEVTDAQGASVEGAVTTVTLDEKIAGDEWSEGRYVVAWKPASELAAQQTYQMSVEAEHPYDSSWLTVDQDISFETSSGPAGQLPTASITSASIDIAELRAGFRCCERDAFCDSCGFCEQCWATRYAYHPQIRAQLGHANTTTIARQAYIEMRVDGEVVDRFWNTPNTFDVRHRFDENASGPFCVEFATISLITGEELHAEEKCFQQSDLPSYTERQLTGEGPPPECAPDAGSPDAGSTDAGTPDVGSSDAGGADSGQADTGNTGGGTTSGNDGGCNQSGPSGPPVVAIIVALLGLGMSRWRSERP